MEIALSWNTVTVQKKIFNWIKKKLLKIRLMTKNKEDINQGFFVPSLG